MNKYVNLALAVVMACGVSGCSKNLSEEKSGPTRENYRYIIAYASRLGQAIELKDINYDGNIDGIVDSKRVLAIDTTVQKYEAFTSYEGRTMYDWTGILDSSTISLANKIRDLESELAFKIDSAIYARECN